FFRGDPDGARDDTDEALRGDPDNWEAQAFRGRARIALGDVDGVDDLTEVIDHGECHKYASELHLERARVRLGLGDPAGAVADCSAAIGLDHHEQADWPFLVRTRPRRAHRAYLLRAEAHLALGDWARALADCFHAVKMAPDAPEAYELRAAVYRGAGDPREAFEDLARAAFLRAGLVGGADSDAARSTAGRA
ncbi:MAG: tetratricopeptide repeat protein, partial [Acidimicrobiia bacterium]